MTQQTAENQIRALIEVWADAVRRHDLPAILAHHEHDIVMFDVPPPFLSRGLDAYKKTWDLFFQHHEPSQAFDIEELAITAGEDVAFAVLVMRCGSATVSGRGWVPVPADNRTAQGRWPMAHRARASFGASDGLERKFRIFAREFFE